MMDKDTFSPTLQKRNKFLLCSWEDKPSPHSPAFGSNSLWIPTPHCAKLYETLEEIFIK